MATATKVAGKQKATKTMAAATTMVGNDEGNGNGNEDGG
jgi:hypothetical protein